jgi:nicotinate-nucleotide pyrophosphorylase (carboxylating)
VDTLDQLREALATGVDVVLLDNMSLPTLREAVALCRGRALTEASGGITPETAREVAQTGVDMISLGFLTHSVRNLDLSLEIARPSPTSV